MPDLEQKIQEWRKPLINTYAISDTRLDELEAHLRDSIESLITSGYSQEQAFTISCERFGNPGSVAAEFEKLKPKTWWPIPVTFLVALILLRQLMQPNFDRLLELNIPLDIAASLYLQFAALFLAFLPGILGLLFTLQRLANFSVETACTQLKSIVITYVRIATFIFAYQSTLSLVTSVITHQPFFLGSQFILFLWLSFALYLLQGKKVSGGWLPRLCILNNIVVLMAVYVPIYLALGFTKTTDILKIFTVLLLIHALSFAATYMPSFKFYRKAD